MKAESPNLDVLRALAVLLVLVDHVVKFAGREWLGPIEVSWMGGFGVFLFFVHTCLVLMLSLERLQRDGGPLLSRFYLRRAFRIYPLSMLAVLTVVTFSIPTSHIANGTLVLHTPSRGEVIANLLLVQNLTHYRNHIIGVLWSLPMEVQMYIMLPFLFLLARRYGPKLILALWTLGVGAAIVQPYVSYRMDLAQFVPHFIPGVVAYALLPQARARFSSAWWPAWLLLLTSIFLVASPSNATGWICCLALGISIPWFEQMTWAPLVRVAHLIAKYSYGIYLGHLFCLWGAFMVWPDLPRVAQWALFTLFMLVLPVVLFHAIEQPMIRLGGRLAAKLHSPAPKLAAQTAQAD